ncbi:MAG: SpoIIE family protein phosphatase [Actinomycetota bacterium]|nr:SpoIIE family protein phosphatase [Actinomycetota bacterium]
MKEIIEPDTDDRDERIRALEQTLESLRAESEVAHVLLGLSAALGEVRTVEDTLDKAVRMVPELCGAERCFAATWDDVNARFEIKAESGYDHEASALLHELAEIEDGFPIIGRALSERTPLLVGDVIADGRIPAERATARQLGAIIGLPLLRWGENFGALAIEFVHPKRFGAKDAALARGIARQVGVALANARRFNLLQGLRSFGLTVGTRASLGAVIGTTAQAAGDLLGGDGAMLYFLDVQHSDLVSASGHGLGLGSEKLGRIDLSADPWDALVRGDTVSVQLRETLGDDDIPSCGVFAGIPGLESPLIGAVGVFFSRSAVVGTDEVEALNVLAAQAGTAIENVRRFERQRRVARALQRGLMTTETPDMKGCRFGAVYEAASSDSDVGGDFFDLFELPDSRVGLVVGDVSGKGAEAAAQTAMAKYMLRAFALRNAAPPSVLFHLNNALVQGLPEDRFTTVLYGLLDPGERRVQIALGGHPPALIYRAETKEVEIVEPEGSIIGAFEDQQFDSTLVQLEEGDVFLAFTDGLLETRNEEELYGRDRVVESLIRHAPGMPAEKLSRHIYDDAAEFGTVSDDTVVFAITTV